MGYPSNSELAEQVADFAANMTPADDRWGYAFRAGTYRVNDKYGVRRNLVLKAMPAISRFIGAGDAQLPLGRLMQADGSVEGARASYTSPYFRERDPYAVGLMEPWQIGHVYFARVKSAPHIVKVGFSRRVRDRIEDIESKNRTRLDVFAVKVGTLADEHWWHNDWRSLRIAGEWFFAPRSTDRTLPDFLQTQKQAA